MSRPLYRVADIAARFGAALSSSSALSVSQQRVLLAVMQCRTAALGGHVEQCLACGVERPAYNSCGNRHCPSCQGSASRAWVAARMVRVLPVSHVHVVFTLPSELRAFFREGRGVMYDLLLRSAARALELGAARRLGAQLGVTAVLHTWNQDLLFHPHVHCIATAGGLLKDGRWRGTKGGYLLPVKLLRSLFRGVFLRELQSLVSAGKVAVPAEWPKAGRALQSEWRGLWRKQWVAYAKRPFAGTEGVFAYLGQYTHRVGISDGRVVGMDEETVTFTRRGKEAARIPGVEFLRRLLLHVLPPGFRKIRHYGLYAPACVGGRLESARATIYRQGFATPVAAAELETASPAPALLLNGEEGGERLACEHRCVSCKVGRMVRVSVIPRQVGRDPLLRARLDSS